MNLIDTLAGCKSSNRCIPCKARAVLENDMGMSLYVQLLKATGNCCNKGFKFLRISRLLKMNWHFVAIRPFWEKWSSATSFYSPRPVNSFCNLQSQGHNVSPESRWGMRDFGLLKLAQTFGPTTFFGEAQKSWCSYSSMFWRHSIQKLRPQSPERRMARSSSVRRHLAKDD